jgi:hypothetical protein
MGKSVVPKLTTIFHRSKQALPDVRNFDAPSTGIGAFLRATHEVPRSGGYFNSPEILAPWLQLAARNGIFVVRDGRAESASETTIVRRDRNAGKKIAVNGRKCGLLACGSTVWVCEVRTRARTWDPLINGMLRVRLGAFLM